MQARLGFFICLERGHLDAVLIRLGKAVGAIPGGGKEARG